MKNKTFCPVVIILLACSFCTNRPNFSDKEQNIFGTEVEIGSLVGRPTEIVCLDSLLLFYDRFDKQTISVFDFKNNQFIRRFLNEGRAPGEVIVPLKLLTSNRNKKLYVFQLQTGIMHEYNIYDIVNTKSEILNFQKYIFKDRPAIIKKIDNAFVGIGLHEDNRYHLYTKYGDFVNSFGNYPFAGKHMNSNDRFFIYQGSLCSNPDGNFFAMGSSYCDNLEFYSVEQNQATLIKKYESYDVKAQYQGGIIINDDCVMNYKASYGNGKYCYMLYSGKTYFENKRRTYGGRKIIVFNWEGNYIKSFEADKDIISFCVNEDNSEIFAITSDDNGYKIQRYHIN